jgi:hypothetical protein
VSDSELYIDVRASEPVGRRGAVGNEKRDGDGALRGAPPAAPPVAVARRTATRARAAAEVLRAGRYPLATAFVVAGGLGMACSLLAGFAVAADASMTANLNSANEALGVAIAVVGSVQSLLLVAFGHLMAYARAGALLLAENLEEVRT